MRIAIVGAGQAGLQLSIGLLKNNYQVTLLNNRTADEILNGHIMSSQGMFDTALQYERELGLNFWQQQCPSNTSVTLNIAELSNLSSNKALSWKGYTNKPFQSIDQRLKFSQWLIAFEALGGNLVIKTATVRDIETLAAMHDLVIIASGKGEICELFERDNEKSIFAKPMRSLACHYVSGMQPIIENPGVRVNLIPGIGEYFTMPGLTMNGPCEMMLFEGVPGGQFDCWDGVSSSEQQLELSLTLLEKYVPWEAERCRDVKLTDKKATLKGSYTPMVRKPIARLPSGKYVLGMGDAIVLNDPIAGQGANNAAKSAHIYLDKILRNENKPFTTEWMQVCFDECWKTAQFATAWSNALLLPPPPHIIELLGTAVTNQILANKIANGFDDPASLFPWIMDAKQTKEVIIKANELNKQALSLKEELYEYSDA